MAKTAAERRAARKRKEQARGRRRPAGHPPGTGRDVALRQLVVIGARAAAGPDAEAELLERIVVELAGSDPQLDGAAELEALFSSLLRALWEHGWQPLDAAHVVARHGRARLTRLMVAGIAAEARLSDAAHLAPEEWREQLSTLDVDGAAAISGWRGDEGLDAVDAWRDALFLLNTLQTLEPLASLAPPPSQWRRQQARRRVPVAGHTGDARVLSRIRGLLAKAESTEYAAEAEALSAKAQDLMSRHAIDAAVLDAEHGSSTSDQIGARRVHIVNPYPEAKVQLLDAVARANGVRAIWSEHLGIATLVGLPFDLDLVDLLFTSLLVQATRAMADAGKAGTRQTRSPSFRRAFLMAYAQRVGERLVEVRDQVTREETESRGAELVPVLRDRSQAVDDAFDTMFPDTYAVERRAMNAHGWRAGRLAAETADLGAGREQVAR